MTATIEGKTDGRLARTVATRGKILAAWLNYYDATGRTPSIAAVSATAGVSPRAVHRCYESMAALHQAGYEARLANLGIVDRHKLDLHIERLCKELRRRLDFLNDRATELTGPANGVLAASTEIAALAAVRDAWAS